MESIIVALIVGPLAAIPAALAAWYSHRTDREIRNGRLDGLKNELLDAIEEARLDRQQALADHVQRLHPGAQQ